MPVKSNLYHGPAGEHAVMSELLWRGWNVAIPQVDVGDDIFVVEDEQGTFYRVQVKTATAERIQATVAVRTIPSHFSNSGHR
jgi:hypothetical protein